MAITLMHKKLAALPIGTRIELIHLADNAAREKLCGTVTDSDFTENIEITADDGTVTYQNFATVCNFRVVSSAHTVPTPGPDGTQAVISTPKVPLLRDREPAELPGAGDPVLKKHFDLLPKADRQKLTAPFDSFRYGVKINDRSKMAEAAALARQLLLSQDRQGYGWSEDAVMLTGLMLQRTQQPDPEVYLLCSRFREAALAAYKLGDPIRSGTYALLELLESDAACPDDMAILAAKAMAEADDAGFLSILRKQGGQSRGAQLDALIKEGFTAKNESGWQQLSTADALARLEVLYPGRRLTEELKSWLSEEELAPEAPPVPVPPPAPAVRTGGVITRLNWSDETGTVVSDIGESYHFRYADVSSPTLEKTLRGCMRADLNGELHCVTFLPDGCRAAVIRPDPNTVEHARTIFASKNHPTRYETARRLLIQAVHGSADRRALPDLMRVCSAIRSSTGDDQCVKEALELYEANPGKFLSTHGNEMELVQCYGFFDNFAAMEEHTDKALAESGLSPKQRLIYIYRLVRLLYTAFRRSPTHDLARRVHKRCCQWEQVFRTHLGTDPVQKNSFESYILPMRLEALCALGKLREAEDDLSLLPETHPNRLDLQQTVDRLRAKLAPKPCVPAGDVPEEAAPATAAEAEAPTEAEEPEAIPPYTDPEGWKALGMTGAQAVSTALGFRGEDPIAPMLSYLHAAARLNPELEALRRTVSLAANDPMEQQRYDVASLMEALETADPDHPAFTDWCMSAAYLRGSFQGGRDFDYTAQGLRLSLSAPEALAPLAQVLETFAHFRAKTGQPLSLYAGHRCPGDGDPAAALAEQARALYTRFVLTAPREGASLLRLIETKKLLFAKDGKLAAMLRAVMDNDADALEALRPEFCRTYLNGSDRFADGSVSALAVDCTVNAVWELAGKNMQLKKQTANLQGTLRNNLRSGVCEILTLVCRRFALAEADAGLARRTEAGAEVFLDLQPQLLDRLKALAEHCDALAGSDDVQTHAGALLLADAARELEAKLTGTWREGQERFRYVSFLKGSQVMLDADFLPELDATFCSLPRFHILHRIQAHAEGEPLTFQQTVDRIFGREPEHQNFAAARQITEYLEFLGQPGPVTLPAQPELYEHQAKLQADLRLRSFLEGCALAANCGRIMTSDGFSALLEDTARHFHGRCRESGSFGFFHALLDHAEAHIHTAAQVYEQELTGQLETLIEANRPRFDAHPGCAEAIRTQIAQQNFLVAEDWMHRIRLGDFTLELQKPEALGLLERFWAEYEECFQRVADTSRPLSSLISRAVIRNKDAKGAQQLIDAWLSNGRPSTAERMTQLLTLLGFQNVRAESCTAAARTELYRVTRQPSEYPAAPRHPIAAFGSALDSGPMYAACLYGSYNCDQLYEKLRSLDAIDGSKVIFLDYALGSTDRRHLARKLKQRRSSLRSTCIVIDRVLLCHLSDHYNEHLMARMLMAASMPFSYYQPYVVESILTMPPEIFIGRKDELQKIEAPDGVNLIYGGRQLGKSALFKKALSDIEGRGGQRALLVDIKELGCADTAKKLCARLMDLGIIPDGALTDDWDDLCRRIERRLRSTDAPIRYLLLMMDEADAFISDCAALGYRPLAALKDLQQALPGRFKFVLAGLHNIVRFNRQVALGRNSVITHLPSLKITPFRSDEAQELLTEPLSYLGFSLPSKVTVSQILATVNYFPGLIQLYCRKLIESIRGDDYAGYDLSATPPYVVTDEHLRRVLSDREFVEQIWEKLEITLTLGQEEGFCYYPLALLIAELYDLEPSQSGYSAKDVRRWAEVRGIAALTALDEEQLDAMMQELMDLNILRCVSAGRYLLASKNFRDLLGTASQISEKLTKLGGIAA